MKKGIRPFNNFAEIEETLKKYFPWKNSQKLFCTLTKCRLTNEVLIHILSMKLVIKCMGKIKEGQFHTHTISTFFSKILS